MRKCTLLTGIAIFLVLCPNLTLATDTASPIRRTLGGLKGTVEIVIDKHGVPHIYSESEEDAMFALGYMHAKDRLWQMDFNRRSARGRLSEVLGPSALDHDRFARTIGIERLARNSEERLKSRPRIYANLRAYAWGVNSFIAGKMPGELPLEFQLFAYQPEPWTVLDSLAIGKGMAWEMSGSLDDFYLGALFEKLGKDAVDELFPIDRYGEVPIIPKKSVTPQNETDVPSPGISEACLQIIRMASNRFRIVGESDAIGSNNWVIDGAKSASGMPMLATDPHLGLQLPCVWHIVHVKAGLLDTIGISLPGVPFVIMGHNRQIAWGMTNTQADVTDIFVETLNEDRTEYYYEGKWRPLKVFHETVKVRGREPVEVVVPVTTHGPVLSTASADFSIQWTGAEPDDDAYAFFLLNYAVDYDDFAAAMRTLNCPPGNFVYADTNGMTAMWVAGLFPIRKSGLGRFPVDGSTSEFDWAGFIPKISAPRTVNPSQHYLASANQRPAPETYQYYLGYQWDPGYRARRINQLLSSADLVTFDAMKEFQADTFDGAAESMLPHMIEACRGAFEENGVYSAALTTLSEWDFLTGTDRVAPTIWWRWLEKFPNAVWTDEWKAAGIDMPADHWGHTSLNKWQPPLEVLERMVVEEPSSKWFDDVSTDEKETLRHIARRSLREAVDELVEQLGDDVSLWQWGRVNRLRIDHLSKDPLLVRGGQPVSGSSLTLNARGGGGEVTGGPSFRMVVDFKNLETTVGALPGGQSGDLASPHYDNLLDKWIRDEYVPLLFAPDPARFPVEHVESRLILSAPTNDDLLTP